MSEVGLAYADLQTRITAAALALVSTALRRGRSSPEAWRDAVQAAGNRLLSLQVMAASLADPFLNDILDAQGADTTAEAPIAPAAFADLTDGGGSWLQSLVYAPNSVRNNGTAAQAWSRFQFVANSIVATGITDTARAAVQTGMQARPAVKGYIRMIRGKTCARCAILAGRRYRRATAFRRHPRCDCVHIPAAEAADDWTIDTKNYFNRLSSEDQDRIFTKAGAEAIRLGSDPAQVVNARDGVYVARAHGDSLLATTTGTSQRGLAGQRLNGEIRLLPDELFLQAEKNNWSREQLVEQLLRFGYLL